MKFDLKGTLEDGPSVIEPITMTIYSGRHAQQSSLLANQLMVGQSLP